MAITLSLQELSENDEAGAYAASLAYLVRDSAGIVLTAADVRGALPALGATYAVGSATAYLRKRTIAPVKGSSRRAWTAALEYAPQESDSTYTATSSSVDSLIVDAWRVGATLPGNLSTPADTDISGTKVDMAGHPISAQIVRQELTVRNIVSAVDYATIRSLIGKRNSATFLGITAGYLLFTGAKDQRVGPSRYEVDYAFVYDALAHLRQVCQRDLDGNAKLTAPDGAGIQRAESVYWRQPFPSTGAFAGLGIVL